MLHCSRLITQGSLLRLLVKLFLESFWQRWWLAFLHQIYQ